MRGLLTAVLTITVLAVLAVPVTATAQTENCTLEATLAGALPSVFQIATDEGTGTAFYIGDGTYITASHIIAGATTATATNHLHVRDLTVTGADPSADFAILSGSGEGIVALPIGNSAELRIGDELIVVGYPGGTLGTGERRGSVAIGVLSARAAHDTRPYVVHLQTDAAGNPGNSGGPVLDRCGNVVGLVSAQIGETGAGVEGIGYAVASETFTEARVRAVEAGPPPLEQSSWWTDQDDVYSWIATEAILGVYANPKQEGTYYPDLWVGCDRRGSLYVAMWWDVPELIGAPISGSLYVSRQFVEREFAGRDWERQSWFAGHADQDNQYVWSRDPLSFVKEVTRGASWVQMWLSDANSQPIGMALFDLRGMPEALQAAGCAVNGATL